MEIIEKFCNQVSLRTAENYSAFNLLVESECFGVAIGILRQELDSLIRVSYLWHEDIEINEGLKLMQDSLNGKKWEKLSVKGKKIKITDREMVELARHLGGWEKVIYDFGCNLIHLSNYHSYKECDPLVALSSDKKAEIVSYLRSYHCYPHSGLNFDLLKPYLPKVIEKLKDNINYFLEAISEKYSTL